MTLNQQLNIYLGPDERVKFRNNMDNPTLLHVESGPVFMYAYFCFTDSPEGLGYWSRVSRRVSNRIHRRNSQEESKKPQPITYKMDKHRMI